MHSIHSICYRDARQFNPEWSSPDIIQQAKPIDKYYCKRKNCLANLSSMCPCQLCAISRFCSFEQNVVWPPKDLLAVDLNLFRHWKRWFGGSGQREHGNSRSCWEKNKDYKVPWPQAQSALRKSNLRFHEWKHVNGNQVCCNVMGPKLFNIDLLRWWNYSQCNRDSLKKQSEIFFLDIVIEFVQLQNMLTVRFREKLMRKVSCTGKSLSEALVLIATNP